MRDRLSQPSRQVAIIIPCYNEGLTIGKVVQDLRSLPDGVVFVYDNTSQDDTADRACEAGATVQIERHRGKGNVVRRMFADIDADVYVLADGDDTYDPSYAAVAVSKLLEEGLDFINVARQPSAPSAYRFGHAFGNKLLSNLVRVIFGNEFNECCQVSRYFCAGS
jgi:glycosyltransferase involved in cell wall biosynthesis